jgi:hypothetical protein
VGVSATYFFTNTPMLGSFSFLSAKRFARSLLFFAVNISSVLSTGATTIGLSTGLSICLSIGLSTALATLFSALVAYFYINVKINTLGVFVRACLSLLISITLKFLGCFIQCEKWKSCINGVYILN